MMATEKPGSVPTFLKDITTAAGFDFFDDGFVMTAR
jgi:hypothetical protein